MFSTTSPPHATTLPIRAIPSTLINRNAPTVPPSSQLYEPLVKATLGHRLLHGIFFHSALYCWIIVTVWSTWRMGGPSNLGLASTLLTPLSLTTVFATFALWVAGPLPVTILRKQRAADPPNTSSSPSKKLHAAFGKPGTLASFLTYATSSILIASIHIFMAQRYEAKYAIDPRLGFFVNSRKHPYYLNGRVLFIFAAQVVIACGSTLRSIMLDRLAVRPSSNPSHAARRPFGFVDILKVLAVAVLLASATLPVSIICFALLRMIVLPVVYRLPLVSIFLKPFTAHFLRRGTWTILLPLRHFWLIVRAWLLTFATFSIWEFTEVLFDAYVSQPILVAQSTADPMLTLVSGVLAADHSLKHHALYELKQLSEAQSSTARARRTAFFADQKYSPSIWSALLHECLLCLGRDYQNFLRRGVPPAPPAPQAAPPPQSIMEPFPMTPKKLIQKPIFQASKQSPIRNAIDALSSDGPLAQAVDAGADAAHFPELFKSVAGTMGSPKPVIAAKEEVKKVAEVGKGLVSRARAGFGTNAYHIVRTYAPKDVTLYMEAWRDWWTKDRLGKVAEGCLPNRHLDVLITEVISHLTCASLTEDQYGIVQRDIPKILEAFLSFLTAIEEYQVELNALCTPPSPDQRLTIKELEERETLRMEVASASDVLSVVRDALKDGVARIVRTFGDKLLAYRFPSRTAAKLQGFMDYC